MPDLPAAAFDDLEACLILFDGLLRRLATAMSPEEAWARAAAAQGAIPLVAGPGGLDPGPLWEGLEALGPARLFSELGASLERLLEALPAAQAERLVVELGPGLDRVLAGAARWARSPG